MPLDLDRLDFDMTTTEDSQRSTLSPHSSQMTIGSHHSIGGLVIPQSASSFVGGPVGGLGGLSVRGDSGAGVRSGLFQPREHEGFLEDDLNMVIDEDGNIRMDDAPVCQPRGPSERADRTDLGSEAARARVRREHEHGRLASDIVSIRLLMSYIDVLIHYSSVSQMTMALCRLWTTTRLALKVKHFRLAKVNNSTQHQSP